jgi:NTP pyrophosphatase (non-canonical NTP hydrolase)
MNTEGGDWERVRREHAARTGWSSGGGWPLTEDEAEEALRLSGLGQDIDRRRSPFSLVIVGAGMRHIIETVDAWLDDAVAGTYQDQPLAQDWARITKVSEEAGEAISALIGATGQNPRKGVIGSMDDVLKELGDCFCAAVFAIQHITQDADVTAEIIEAALMKAFNRATGATKPAE